MKKILMASSALALAGMVVAAPGKAEAATWDLDWGGYFNSAVIYRTSDNLNDSDPDQEGIDVVQDAEIDFHPSITLDNGLTFGVNVELEAESAATTNIDESSVFVTGSFGRVVIGADDGPANTMHYGAPNVGWFGAADGGDVAGYLNINALNYGRSPAFGSDSNKIAYFTPRFAGFQVGASYAHDESPSKNNPSGGTHENLFELGANYVNSFGAFDIAVSGVYAHAEGVPVPASGARVINASGQAIGGIQPNSVGTLAPGTAIQQGLIVLTPAVGAVSAEDSDMYGFGATLGYAGFAFGGNYTRQDIQGEGDERDYYDLGVAYTTGPWGVSVQWAHSEIGSIDENHYHGAVTYDLGPGVTAGVYAGFSEADYGPGNDPDGFLVGTGFALSF